MPAVLRGAATQQPCPSLTKPCMPEEGTASRMSRMRVRFASSGGTEFQWPGRVIRGSL
jgi:hypothetical protein